MATTRIGRPFKTPIEGKRAQISLLVRPSLKRLIDQRAQVNGRTQSAEGEMMIERGLVYDDLLGVRAGMPFSIRELRSIVGKES